MENDKANTWQACCSRRHRCARVFFSFLRWEVLENERHSHPHPRHSTCSALASWASSGSLPLGKATISSNFLSLCVSFSLKLSQSLTLFFASLSAPAARRSSTAAVWPFSEALMRAVRPSYTWEERGDGGWSEWAAKERNKVCLRGASMVWGGWELRGVGQGFTHVGMKAHV
jgi:hypothetical protein